MVDYDPLERPVINESSSIMVTFGITLQQIIDVVSNISFFLSITSTEYGLGGSKAWLLTRKGTIYSECYVRMEQTIIAEVLFHRIGGNLRE